MFLIIRSGNSHELVNHSDRPAISYMENQVANSQNVNSNDFLKLKYSQANSNGLGGHGNHIVLEQESEDFQLWKDYYHQMVFFSCLIAFTFLLFFPNKGNQKPIDFILDNNPNPIFISQRSLRI